MFDVEYKEGYAAGLRFHIDGLEKEFNPYDEDDKHDQYRFHAWEDGFEQAGEDS